MGEPTATAILVVEDNPADVCLIRKALQDCGYNVPLAVVANGRDALAFLHQEGPYAREPVPALILLDLNLPQLPGHEVLAALRRLPLYHATPVVVLSGENKEDEESCCQQLGATAYVQKPLTYAAYVDIMQALVRQWLKPEAPHARSSRGILTAPVLDNCSHAETIDPLSQCQQAPGRCGNAP
jgi:CheY-like chemotaxis protein